MQARRAALKYLARRDYSRHEIQEKLKHKGFTRDIISPLIEELIQAELINEQRFIENYLHWRSKKGYGPLRIIKELQTRGISPDMIAEQLHITDNAWTIQAQKVWQKHFKGKIAGDFKLRAKQMRFLQYRGFTQEQILSVFGSKDNQHECI